MYGQINQLSQCGNGYNPYQNPPYNWPSHVTHSWALGMAEQMYLPRLLEVLERIATALETQNKKAAD